ncbi:hypothetical protein B0H63DRAFT_112763 [Podospora didyma]|uniref:Uncharacterized protein n=1 Tax=Podospora didyma TaxID=330526 RepID=A0AAE0NZ76_9PEZI|nr:hypothetical protein B0H63DRAFT_112763 [Podospora didyma]
MEALYLFFYLLPCRNLTSNSSRQPSLIYDSSIRRNRKPDHLSFRFADVAFSSSNNYTQSPSSKARERIQDLKPAQHPLPPGSFHRLPKARSFFTFVSICAFKLENSCNSLGSVSLRICRSSIDRMPTTPLLTTIHLNPHQPCNQLCSMLQCRSQPKDYKAKRRGRLLCHIECQAIFAKHISSTHTSFYTSNTCRTTLACVLLCFAG